MERSLEIGRVAEALPDLNDSLADPRLRPIGLVGGFSIVIVGALLQLPVWNSFWATVLSGVLVFVGVPLFCVGLAAPEPPEEDDLFRLGIELTESQRQIVASGSLLVLISPMIVAAAGPYVGFGLPLWLAAATFALVGSVLVLTGFIAWTSRRIGETAPSR